MKGRYEAPGIEDRRIWDLFLSGTHQATIVAADDAGIFASLDKAPATIPELAGRMGLDERATGIVLRLLASLGLLIPHHERFQLTSLARIYLLPSSPWYWGPMFRVGVSEWHLETLTQRLKQAKRTGGVTAVGPPGVSGEGRPSDAWASGQVSLEQARDIAARMHAHSLPAAIGAAHHYDLSGVKQLLDVGGGSGCFAIAMARAHPHLHATIMELPAMCEVAHDYIESGNVADRVDTLAVDMFREDWPRGYDAVFFSNVWHDWSFGTCRWLGERAFAALPSGGRILLHEMLLDDDGAGPVTAAGFSMLMLLATQGQQFTLRELEDILGSAGFSRVETRPTYAYYSITTAYKP